MSGTTNALTVRTGVRTDSVNGPRKGQQRCLCEWEAAEFRYHFPLHSCVWPNYCLGEDKKGGTIRVMEDLNARARHVVATVIIALLVAAVLRHVLHVHVGYSREEIRAGALIGFAAVLLAWLALVRVKRAG